MNTFMIKKQVKFDFLNQFLSKIGSTVQRTLCDMNIYICKVQNHNKVIY